MSLLDTASLIVTPNGYKEGTLYSVVPSSGAGDLSVTRATTATRVNSSGLIESVGTNIPRLDYSNGSCPSILVEPQRTNVALYSSSFDNASWTAQTTIVTANDTTAPDGTTSAETLTPSGSGAYDNRVYQTQTVTNGAVYTLSVWAKSSASNAKLTLGLQNHGGQVFNITDQWERYSVAVTALSTGGNFNIYAGDVTPTTGTVNSSNVVTIWGSQLEAGSYPTSYIPTTSASVTRNADVISKTGISSLIGQTEGTIFVDFNRTSTNEGGLQLGNSDGPNDYLNSIILQWNINGVYANIFVSGATQFSNTSSSVTGRHKLAIVYKANDFALYIDGVQIATDTSGSIPSLAGIFLNHQNFASTGTNINITALWKTRLTNSQLAQLTTL